MRILICDGNERAALAAARSLVRARYEVHAAAGSRWTLAGASRGVGSPSVMYEYRSIGKRSYVSVRPDGQRIVRRPAAVPPPKPKMTR